MSRPFAVSIFKALLPTQTTSFFCTFYTFIFHTRVSISKCSTGLSSTIVMAWLQTPSHNVYCNAANGPPLRRSIQPSVILVILRTLFKSSSTRKGVEWKQRMNRDVRKVNGIISFWLMLLERIIVAVKVNNWIFFWYT